MKEVLMVLPHMVGGGAERVAAMLVNYFDKNGIKSKIVLTADYSKDVVRHELKEDIPLILLKEVMDKESLREKIRYYPAKIGSKVGCHLFEAFHKPVPAYLAYLSVVWQYHREIKYLKNLIGEKKETTVIAFLQPAIPLVLLATRSLPNKVIISERCDPNRLMKKRYGKLFIKKYYTRADKAVFQTKEAKEVYPKNVGEKGFVIENPIKKDLPEAYYGERNTTITTFCRISEQKNLPVLIEAFAKLHEEYPEYKLKIIGDAPNEEGVRVRNQIVNQMKNLKIDSAVELVPFMNKVHEEILKDAMYVNSSDYEGMSNAMLEAMAIGMPVVCTDCPIGGAHAAIEHGENGLLVPVKDAQVLYMAMKQIIEDNELSQRLSKNAVKIREKLSLENIANQWMELL